MNDRDIALVIPTKAQLTARGVTNASARKQQRLKAMVDVFRRAIESDKEAMLAIVLADLLLLPPMAKGLVMTRDVVPRYSGIDCSAPPMVKYDITRGR